jgi:hypothetical protein
MHDEKEGAFFYTQGPDRVLVRLLVFLKVKKEVLRVAFCRLNNEKRIQNFSVSSWQREMYE